MEAKRIPYLGFAITNILKIFNKYNFKNGYLQNNLRKKRGFFGWQSNAESNIVNAYINPKNIVFISNISMKTLFSSVILVKMQCS